MNPDRAERFWQRVHAALDRRLDPLDDEIVQQALLDDEATRDAYARLIEGLRAVPRAGRPAAPRLRLRLRVSASIATAVATAAAAWLLWPRPVAPALPLGEPSALLRLRVAHADTDGVRALDLQSDGGRSYRTTRASQGPLLRHVVTITKSPP